MNAGKLQVGIATGSGTLLSFFAAIGSQDLLKTVVLAAVGATVSFAVSWLLHRISGGRRR